MKTQQQHAESARRNIAEKNKDLMFLRKTTAKHYIDDGIDFATAWDRELAFNLRTKRETSIIFPNRKCFMNHYNYAIANPMDDGTK